MSAYKLIVGLGNPGPTYYYQRHSIGFRVLDALADRENLSWTAKKQYEQAVWQTESGPVILLKPMTYMNTSGTVLPDFLKKGIAAENILVVHDELELPFGKVAFKIGGSHKGHNGLKSIMQYTGADFGRIRVGISRPVDRDAVPDYVLAPFNQSKQEVDAVIEQAVALLIEKIK